MSTCAGWRCASELGDGVLHGRSEIHCPAGRVARAAGQDSKVETLARTGQITPIFENLCHISLLNCKIWLCFYFQFVFGVRVRNRSHYARPAQGAMAPQFQRLVRFEDPQGIIRYGEAGLDWSKGLVGQTVPTFTTSNPYDDDYTLSGNHAKISRVRSTYARDFSHNRKPACCCRVD